MNVLAFISKRKRKRKNGHWLVYLVLTVLVVCLWFIPFDTLASGIDDFEAKINLISAAIRAIAVNLTTTVKSMGTFAAAVLALLYVIYNRNKPNAS